MPNQCSAPGCRSNYRGEPCSPVFKLPNTPPELREQWLKSLHPVDIENLKHIYVCLHHFKPEDIITVDKIMQADGKFTEKFRERPKLRTTAVPMLLPGCPAYLSAEQVGRPTRFTRESKEVEQFARALELSLQQHERDNDAFMVNSFQDLIEKIPVLLLPNMWMVCHYDCDALHLYINQSYQIRE